MATYFFSYNIHFLRNIIRIRRTILKSETFYDRYIDMTYTYLRSTADSPSGEARFERAARLPGGNFTMLPAERNLFPRSPRRKILTGGIILARSTAQSSDRPEDPPRKSRVPDRSTGSAGIRAIPKRGGEFRRRNGVARRSRTHTYISIDGAIDRGDIW